MNSTSPDTSHDAEYAQQLQDLQVAQRLQQQENQNRINNPPTQPGIVPNTAYQQPYPTNPALGHPLFSFNFSAITSLCCPFSSTHHPSPQNQGHPPSKFQHCCQITPWSLILFILSLLALIFCFIFVVIPLIRLSVPASELPSGSFLRGFFSIVVPLIGIVCSLLLHSYLNPPEKQIWYQSKCCRIRPTSITNNTENIDDKLDSVTLSPPSAENWRMDSSRFAWARQ